MKKSLCLLLLLSLLLCACGFSLPKTGSPAQTIAPAAAPTPSPAPAPEPSPAPAPTPEPVVIYDAFCETGTYYDDVNNKWDYVLRIPAIQAPGADATRLNSEIFAALYPSVNDAKDCMIGGYSLVVWRVDYTVYVNGQLISILAEVDTDWGFDSYYTINYDASTYSELTRAQLLQRYGLTEESFPAEASAVVDRYFQQTYSNIARDEFYQDRYDHSTALENFRSDCQLYVNELGQLCMIAKLYSFAGADYYYHIFVVR